MLRSTFSHHQSLTSQDLLYSLTKLATGLPHYDLTCSIEGLSYIVDFTSLFLVSIGPSDPREPGKEPFHHSVDGIGRGNTSQHGTAGSDVEAEEVFHRHQVGSRGTGSQAVFTSHLFGGQRVMTLRRVSWHHGEVPPGQGVSATERLGQSALDWRLHLQDVAAQGCILILLGLLDVLPSMPDLVVFGVRPLLIALRFGLGEQLFGRGASGHLGCREGLPEGRRRNWRPTGS